MRIASFLLVLITVFTAAPAVYATGTADDNSVTFELSTDVTSVRRKQQVEVTIKMKNNTSSDIDSVSFEFVYDSSYIRGIVDTFNTSAYSTIINDVSTPNTNNPLLLGTAASGNLIILNYNPSDVNRQHTPIRAGKTLQMTIPLVVDAKSPTGTTTLTVTACSAADSTGAALPVSPTYPKVEITVPAKSNDATLESIGVTANNSPVNLNPAFSKDITNYTVTIGNSVPSFGIEPKCSDSLATFAAGAANPKSITAGQNTFTYTVTAEDGVTTKTYTVVVTMLAPGETTTAPINDVTTTTTTTTAMTTMTQPPTTTTTQFDPALILTPDDDEGDDSGDTGDIPPTEDEPTQDKAAEGTQITLNLASLLGIIGAAIALFLLAFAAGYVSHKNASQPQKYTVEELMEAQEKLEMQNRLANFQQQQQPQQPALPTYPQPYAIPASGGYSDPNLSYSPTAYGSQAYPDPSSAYAPAAAPTGFTDFSGMASEFIPQEPGAVSFGDPTVPMEMNVDGVSYPTDGVYYS